MFNFLFKKYKDRINFLERQLEHINYEWEKEKECYTPITQKRIYAQKVDFVIGGLVLYDGREIHRPLCGLNSDDVREITKMVRDKVIRETDFSCYSDYHYDEDRDVYVIDVRVIPKTKAWTATFMEDKE